MKAATVSVLLTVGLSMMVFFTWVGKNDREVTLRQNVISQQDVCKAKFSEMFSQIAQTAQVPEQFMEKSKEAFKEIYQPLIEGRYRAEDGSQKEVLMNWIQESNPQFDMAAAGPLYAKIQQIIEIKRGEFFNEQKKLISFHQEHTVFVSTFMNRNMFMLGDRLIGHCEGEVRPGDDFCLQIIEVKEGKETYKTGIESDLSLF